MIVLERISKTFNRGSVNAVVALDGIDLTVAAGDFITIIGSNGAGKSTLLNCIAGGFATDGGRVYFDELEVSKWPEHRRAKYISRVFQDPLLGTCGSLTIEQNLALAHKRGQRRRLRIGVRKKDRRYFHDQLQILALGLENRLRDRVGLLSGGQRQALTMIMATMRRPKVLLLDEHTAALDPKTARQILALTRKIVETDHLTTLMVTHNMRHALTLGNRLIMLHRGRTILDVAGAQKQALTTDDLLDRFYAVQGEAFASDRTLLAE